MNSRTLVAGAVLAATLGCADEGVDSLRLPVGIAEAEAGIRDDLERGHAAAIAALGDPENDDVNRAASVGDYGVSLLAHGFFQQATESFALARQLDPGEFQWHYFFGHAARRTGDAEAATEGFTAALAADPFSLPAKLWRAETLLHRERLDEAEEDFRRALEQDPYCGQAFTGLGKIELSRGDFERAEPLLRQALEHQPRSPRARYSLALALRGQGRTEEARREFSRLEGENYSLTLTCFEDPWITRMRRRQTGTRSHQDRAMQAMERGLPATALVELQAAVRANPNRYPARVDIAGLLARLGRIEEAKEELRTLLEARPEYPAALLMLAQLSLDEGDLESAERFATRAIAADPEAEAHHEVSGSIALARQDWHAALEAFDRSLTLDPASRRSLLGKAEAVYRIHGADAAYEGLLTAQRGLGAGARSLAASGRLDDSGLGNSHQAGSSTGDELSSALALLALEADRPLAEALDHARRGNREPSVIGSAVLAKVLSLAGDLSAALEWQRRALDSVPGGLRFADQRQRLVEDLARLEAGRATGIEFSLASFGEPLGLTRSSSPARPDGGREDGS